MMFFICSARSRFLSGEKDKGKGLQRGDGKKQSYSWFDHLINLLANEDV